MLDAYDHEYIPEHLLTREFLTEVKSLLKPGGVLAANTFSSSKLYNNESVTYRAVFGEFYNLKAANRIILARNGALPSLSAVRERVSEYQAVFAVDWNAEARILTDQYSPANLLNTAP
jgi:spermidine synthase